MRRFIFIVGIATVSSTIAAAALTPTPPLAAPAVTKVVLEPRTPMQHIDPKKLAKELLHPQQYKCLAPLIGKESAWRSVNNPTSSAKGVGQLLASTYKNLGMRHPESEASQIIAALAYIGRKYGSGGPCAAWKHWQEQKSKTGIGWY
jgi:hypothetical protein